MSADVVDDMTRHRRRTGCHTAAGPLSRTAPRQEAAVHPEVSGWAAHCRVVRSITRALLSSCCIEYR